MQHDFSYWNGCATISDELYDHLPDANQEIGSEALGNTVKHPRLVLSLEKTYNSELPQIFTGLDFVAFDAWQGEFDKIATESDLIGRLEALNFCVARTINNPDERKQVPYATDGVVYKINNRAKQKALGATKYAPKGQIAQKFLESAGALRQSTMKKVSEILDKGDQRQKKLGKGEKLKKNQKKLNFFKIYRYAIYSVYPHINWCDEFLHISIIYKRLFGKYDMYMNTQ